MHSTNRWCFNSGRFHLCKDGQVFVTYQKLQRCIKLENNVTIQAIGKGDVRIGSRGKLLTIKNVFHVPDLLTNVISVPTLIDNHLKVIFNKNRATVLDLYGNILVSAERIGDLLYLFQDKIASPRENKSDMEIWHNRLAHLDKTSMMKMASKQPGKSLKFQTIIDLRNCKACLNGKKSKLKSPNSKIVSKELLEIVHVHIFGPMSTESKEGSRYFMTLIDDKSRWTQVYFLLNRTDAVTKFYEYNQLVETLTKRMIKTIQFDNGNEELGDLIRDWDIDQCLTTEQIGIAEYKSHMLVDLARCMMIQAGLPPHFWVEAIATANYVRNRCPIKELLQATPYEKWTGKRPYLNHLRTFGSKVLIVRNSCKFNGLGTDGIFVGYQEEPWAYRVWIPGQQEVRSFSTEIRFTHEFNNLGSFADFVPESLVILN